MKPRYRIAMVAPGPFPCPRGSQVLVRELAEALAGLGHTVHVIAYGGGAEMSNAPGVHVHRTPAILGGAASFGPRPWRLVLNLFLLATLYRVVREHGVHVIHAHNYEAPALAYVIRFLLGIPVVYHAHNLMGDELEYYYARPWVRRLARRLGRLLDRVVPRRADWVVALSEGMAQDLRTHGVAPERLEVIPPGLFPSPSGEGPHPDPYPGSKVVVYAGNLDPYQDIATLVRAMIIVRKAEPGAVLVIVTHGAESPAELHRLDAAEGVEVLVTEGFAEVRPLLKRADVLVCPRTSWSGFPIKLLNYMAAARPIVLSGGMGRSLGEGPWITVPDRDPASLAQAILRALGDPGLRARLEIDARRVVGEVYDWSRLVPRIERVYGRVV